jgi:biopolymer transport protein ExbB/TolQ
MSTSPRNLFAIITALCLFAAGVPSWAGPSSASPNLLAAMKALQAAKTADDPNPDLQEALKDLNKATNNAGGKRDEAITLVNEAVDLAKNPDKDEMIAKIDHAIAELHAGMARGGNRR